MDILAPGKLGDNNFALRKFIPPAPPFEQQANQRLIRFADGGTAAVVHEPDGLAVAGEANLGMTGEFFRRVS